MRRVGDQEGMAGKGTIKAGLVLCGVLLTGCSAQPTPPAEGAVKGQVAAYGGPLGAKSGPVAGQTVALTDAALKVIATTKTDGRGLYSLSVPPGTYTVTGDVCTQAVHVVTIRPASVQTLDLVCQRR